MLYLDCARSVKIMCLVYDSEACKYSRKLYVYGGSNVVSHCIQKGYDC
jgi:hypothetical protein